MDVCISHQTALSYMLRVPNLRKPGVRQSRASAVPKSVPGADVVRELHAALEDCLPEGHDRLDVLVSTEAGRHNTKSVRAHLCTMGLPPGSFIPTDAWGVEFHVCSPELVFLQMAGAVELDHLIYVGFALCSSFRLDGWEPGGCVKREGFDIPLTTVDRIRAYLERLPEGTKNRAVALRALRHVRPNARSPREAGIAMVIGLPPLLGGHKLGKTSMNQEIRVYDGVDARGEPRWVTRIPDILVVARDRAGRERRVGVDFDAKSTHEGPVREYKDVDRRNLMAPDPTFTHITLGSAQVDNYVAFCREVDRIRRALGQRQKPRLAGNPDSEHNRRFVAEARSRQFELWNRVLGAERLLL